MHFEWLCSLHLQNSKLNLNQLFYFDRYTVDCTWHRTLLNVASLDLLFYLQFSKYSEEETCFLTTSASLTW